jgi:hypothetical protein
MKFLYTKPIPKRAILNTPPPPKKKLIFGQQNFKLQKLSFAAILLFKMPQLPIAFQK